MAEGASGKRAIPNQKPSEKSIKLISYPQLIEEKGAFHNKIEILNPISKTAHALYLKRDLFECLFRAHVANSDSLAL